MESYNSSLLLCSSIYLINSLILSFSFACSLSFFSLLFVVILEPEKIRNKIKKERKKLKKNKNHNFCSWFVWAFPV